MGNHSTCPVCETCPDCSCPVCPTQEEFKCDTSLVEESDNATRGAALNAFEESKKTKQTRIDQLQKEVKDLTSSKRTNAEMLNSLTSNVESSAGKKVGDYTSGEQSCRAELAQKKKSANDCDAGRSSRLAFRNASCTNLQSAVQKTTKLSGDGWSQCDCPNGTVRNQHSVCAPEQTNCVSCEDNYWMDGMKCTPVTICKDNEYAFSPPTRNKDRLCKSLTVCGQDQFESRGPGTLPYTRDRVCKNTTACGPYEFAKGGSTTADVTCHKNKCTCPGGTPVADCPSDGLRVCATCAASHYKHGDSCFPLTNCGKNDGQYVTVHPSANRDRQCAPLTECGSGSYEKTPPVYDNADLAITNRECVALTTCDGTFVRTKREPDRDRGRTIGAVTRETTPFDARVGQPRTKKSLM